MLRRVDMKRKDFHTASDCWTKGWDFESQLMIRYVLIIAAGVGGSYLILGKAQFLDSWALKTGLDVFTFIFLVGFLVLWPTVLILLRRRICYTFRKDRDAYLARKAALQERRLID